jgi:hypothetical protein
MRLWDILVLGTLRLNLNCDYDRVIELANEHNTLRQMLGHGLVDEEDKYRLQTLKDNVSLLTPSVLDDINQIVVQAGHGLLGKDTSALGGRCDSFVVETDVHYPTDINITLLCPSDILHGTVGLGGRRPQQAGLPSTQTDARRTLGTVLDALGTVGPTG